MRHHITESQPESRQALDWLEDHDHGRQGLIAASAASIVPAESLAEEAEAAEMWWNAALRWNAFGLLKMAELGSHAAAMPYFKLAVAASAKASAAPTSVGDTSVSFTLFDQNTFDLFGLNFLLKSFDPAALAEYGERYQQVLATEAGQSRPLMCYSSMMTLDWFPALLECTDEQSFSDANWRMSKHILDMCDESASCSEDDRMKAKPLLAWTVWCAGDTIVHSPAFSWELFGENGNKLFEYQNEYRYDVHNQHSTELTSNDIVLLQGAPFVLMLQFGRVADAVKLTNDSRTVAVRMGKSPEMPGYHWVFTADMAFTIVIYHLLGLSDHVRSYFDMLGLTFDNVEETLETKTRESGTLGILFAPLFHKGAGAGTHSLSRYVMHMKSFAILHLDVPKPKAIAWLEALPNNEDFIAMSMTTPLNDHAALFGSYQTCWIALAHEKVGLYEGAIRFANLQLEPDMRKAGLPKRKWPQVIALACKARALAALNQNDEALAAFQGCISTSRESYSMMEVIANRELANYASGGEAAVQAGVDLETKLETFKSQMSQDEFASLTIRP